MNDDCDITSNLIDNILANIKILREHYSSYIEEADLEILLNDGDFQWFWDELEDIENEN